MKAVSIPYENVDFVVSPETAELWLSRFNYKHQRAIRPYQVSNLARMMMSGEFRQKTQINFMRLADRFFLTNGQHTLSAIKQSGISQRLCVIVSDAKNMADVADDFARHDTHLTRQLSDSLVAHEIDVELGVTRTQLQWISTACLYYHFLIGKTGERGTVRATNDEKLSTVRLYGDLAKQCLSYFEGNANKTYLTRKTTLSVVMFCANKEPELAEEFWTSIAMDDGLKLGDPRKTLLEYFKTHVTNGGASGATYTGRKATTDQEFVKIIAAAWNAWVEGRQLKLLKCDFSAPVAEFARVGTVYPKGIGSPTTSSKTPTTTDQSRRQPPEARA